MRNIDEFIGGIDTLPPAPQVLPQLLSLLSNPDTDISQIAELISLDPGLTAKVLSACNSALLGTSTPVSDIPAAVHRLGLQPIYRIVAVVNGAHSLRPSNPAHGVNAAELWQHAVTTALAAQIIGRDRDQDAGSLFTAGLLHDIGKVILAEAFKKDYARFLEEAAASGSAEPMILQEKRAFGFHHAELGARLMARWKFPAHLVVTVWHHHAPEGGRPFETLAACIALANAVARRVSGAKARRPHAAGADDKPSDSLSAATAVPAVNSALQILQLQPDALDAYVARAEEDFEFVNAMCRLGG